MVESRRVKDFLPARFDQVPSLGFREWNYQGAKKVKVKDETKAKNGYQLLAANKPEATNRILRWPAKIKKAIWSNLWKFVHKVNSVLCLFGLSLKITQGT